jgi:hypothetical protein
MAGRNPCPPDTCRALDRERGISQASGPRPADGVHLIERRSIRGSSPAANHSKELNMKIKRAIQAGVLAAALAGAGIATLPQATQAEERVCRGTIGATTVDNLRVPDGASCTLDGTYVKGTVKVEGDAKLVARKVHVVGNIQAEDSANVRVLAGSRVGGSIQLAQGVSARIYRVKVKGDLQFLENSGTLSAEENTIGGNLQAFQNSGGLKIARNVIDGNLQCKENRPAPTGGKNTVDGNKEDQCKHL